MELKLNGEVGDSVVLESLVHWNWMKDVDHWPTLIYFWNLDLNAEIELIVSIVSIVIVCTRWNWGEVAATTATLVSVSLRMLWKDEAVYNVHMYTGGFGGMVLIFLFLGGLSLWFGEGLP